MNLTMTDGKEKIPVEKMRRLFEASVKNTPALAKQVKLEPITSGEQFRGYIDAEADALWLGFALGLRCGQRIHKARLWEVWRE